MCGRDEAGSLGWKSLHRRQTVTATESTVSDVAQEGPSLADQMCERLVGAGMAMGDLVSVYLGDRLGLYAGLRELGEATPGALAERGGVAERYAREWLAQQAATGIVEATSETVSDKDRTYRLTPAYVPLFLDPDDPVYVIGLVRAMFGIARRLDAVAEAFRSGEGVPYASYGPDVLEGQEGMTRPVFSTFLGSSWLPAIPAIHEKLSAPGARLADVACGGGWSSIAIARAYPGVTIEAVDTDPYSVERARANVRAAGLGDRIAVRLADGADLVGPFDVVTVFEAIHDMSRPVDVLRSIHSALKVDGLALIVDENVGDTFSAPAAAPFDAFFYAASLALCLPTSLAEQPSAATGAVMRPATLERYAREAGFKAVETQAIDYPFWRFYVLRP
jgi:2-polyprenyl-3-methyl-5-hydroxy-6-metoxy-1,4-benzoquinol methylase